MSGLNSWLPSGGENLFQKIKAVCHEAENEGRVLYRLSIGQPAGPALESALKKAAEYVLSSDECWHEYQDNGCVPVPDLAQRLVQAHVPINLTKHGRYGELVDFLPTPGIKPMLGLVIRACLNGRLWVKGMTDPGYPVPAIWAQYLGDKVEYWPFKADDKNDFRSDFARDWSEIRNCSSAGFHCKLAMLNFPHNPSGQIATRGYWRDVCEYCVAHGIRLFNDGAYLALAHEQESCSLTEVAVEYPELSWLEAFSVSKSIANGTGWRVGAMAGSPDFVGDLRTIKGNTDSGFFAPAAVGSLYALENDQAGISAVREKYRARLDLMIGILRGRGWKLAVSPGAGFFTLWRAPKRAFGRNMADAEEFNLAMIKNTGIVGVPFGSYIRYAVCGPIEDWLELLDDGFGQADAVC